MSNIITINSKSKLSIDNNCLIIQREEEENAIPFSEITAIIIQTIQCSITASVNIFCAKYKILLIYCDERHNPISQTIGLNTFYKQTTRMIEQVNWTANKKSKYFFTIIKQKLQHQLDILIHFNLTTSYFRARLKNINSKNFLEIEAQCAKIYFKQLFGKDFIRFHEDKINHALNYGYSLLRSVIKQLLVAKGLQPALGIQHHNQFNNYNLADDLIEIYRPMVDFIVHKYIVYVGEFDKEDKKVLQQILFQLVELNGIKMEYMKSVEFLIDNLINYQNRAIKAIYLPKLIIKWYKYEV